MREPEEILAGLSKFGLEGFSHTDHGLVAHLKGTHDLLKSWDCEEAVCLAGLCHSLYGTEAYRQTPVDLSERDEIKELIGTRAEELAYFFGAMKRQSLYDNLDFEGGVRKIADRLEEKEVSIDEKTFCDLMTLMMANWLEQRPRAPKDKQNLRQDMFLKTRPYLPVKGFQDFLQAYGLEESTHV